MGNQFDAFISYRHCDPDAAVAQMLHDELLNARMPRRYAKMGHSRRLTNIFRDREELRAEGDLSGTLQQTLDNSRYLLLICSVNTPQSEWVNAEAEYFIRVGRADRIIPILINGDKESSLPRALAAYEREFGNVVPIDARVKEEKKDNVIALLDTVKFYIPEIFLRISGLPPELIYEQMKKPRILVKMFGNTRDVIVSVAGIALILAFAIGGPVFIAVNLSGKIKQAEIRQRYNALTLSLQKRNMANLADLIMTVSVPKIAQDGGDQSEVSGALAECREGLDDALGIPAEGYDAQIPQAAWYQARARIDMHEGRMDDAQSDLQQSLRILEKLIGGYEKSIDNQTVYCVDLYLLAQVYDVKKDYKSEIEAMKKEIPALIWLNGQNGNQYKPALAQSYNRLGDSYRKIGDEKNAATADKEIQKLK